MTSFIRYFYGQFNNKKKKQLKPLKPARCFGHHCTFWVWPEEYRRPQQSFSWSLWETRRRNRFMLAWSMVEEASRWELTSVVPRTKKCIIMYTHPSQTHFSCFSGCRAWAFLLCVNSLWHPGSAERMIQWCVKKCRWVALNTSAEIDADYIHHVASDHINLNLAEEERVRGKRRTLRRVSPVVYYRHGSAASQNKSYVSKQAAMICSQWKLWWVVKADLSQ